MASPVASPVTRADVAWTDHPAPELRYPCSGVTDRPTYPTRAGPMNVRSPEGSSQPLSHAARLRDVEPSLGGAGGCYTFSPLLPSRRPAPTRTFPQGSSAQNMRGPRTRLPPSAHSEGPAWAGSGPRRSPGRQQALRGQGGRRLHQDDQRAWGASILPRESMERKPPSGTFKANTFGLFPLRISQVQLPHPA